MASELQAALQAKASDALAALKALDGNFILAFQAGIKSITLTPRLEGDVTTVTYAINSKAGPKSNGGTGTKRPRIQYTIDNGKPTYRARAGRSQR